jgi:tripartite-type tricarboxylate transporter receptor subunit TctC
MTNVRCLLLSVLTALAAVVSCVASAQQYPSRPIRMILPLPPGASVDALARLVSLKLSERLQQPVLVDNRPGGNMIIGAEAVARSAPDGYTLFLTMDLPLVANPSLYSKLPYNAEKDFVPISLLAVSPMVITAHPKVPARNLKELVAYAKANPGKLSFGAGVVAAQLAGELFKMATGTDIVYVPFKGGGPTQQALLGGVVDLAITDFTPVLPYLQNGRLIAMGTTGPKRDPLAPNVPTMIEQGYPDMELTNWIGLLAPAGTPPAILRKLNEEVVIVMSMPDVREKVSGLAVEPMTSSMEEMAARITQDSLKWGRIIKAAGVRLD